MSLTSSEVLAELERAGRSAGALNGDGPPGWAATCPLCPGEIHWREGDRAWTCVTTGCDPTRIADEIHAASTRTYNERLTAGQFDAEEARLELEVLYGLDKLDIRITGARIVGTGSRASADVYLDDGVITFETLKDAARPSTLLPELAASVGATPPLKQQQALHGVTLLRRLAEHYEGTTADDIAREWGHDYLAAADRLEGVEWDDQAQRWQVFQKLGTIEPFSISKEKGISVGAASLVVVAVDGRTFVRTLWFRDAIRRDSGPLGPPAIATAMMRVGWLRPGKEGRIIARRPGFKEHDIKAFYVVPSGWDEAPADEGVKADEGSSTRRRAPAQKINTHQPSSLHQAEGHDG